MFKPQRRTPMKAISKCWSSFILTARALLCRRKVPVSRITLNLMLLTVVGLVECFTTMPISSRTIAIRVGATIGREGPCAPVFNDTALGYQYFFNWLAKQPTSALTDATGRNYTLQFQFRMVTHDCTETGRHDAMASLINGTSPDPTTREPGHLPVHVVLGGNGNNAAEDALQADAAARLLLHCCTARDSVFQMDLPYVYGIFAPASSYTSTVLRTMALRGLKSVAVVYNKDSPLFSQLCEGALEEMPVLRQLRPSFRGVMAVNYSVAESKKEGFWEYLAARVARSGADTLIACDDMSRTSILHHLLKTTHHYHLSAVWLASWGNPDDFMSYIDGRGELTLTAVQWLPSLPYADSMFGTAAEYSTAFASATGRTASYFSAAASVTGYVLLTAIKRAVSMCKLTGLDGTSADVTDQMATAAAAALGDAFMWQENALTCRMARGSASLGSESNINGVRVLRYVLDNFAMETFFGPIAFDGYRQNVWHPAVTAQVHNGQLVAVLPLDVADTALVMPIPAPPPPSAPWRTSPAGISIITLTCCLGLLLLLLLFTVSRRHFAPRLTVAAAVTIDYKDIQVDFPPVLFPNGSAESGEGVYRGTRVKLDVATELLPSIPSSRLVFRQGPPSVLCSSGDDNSGRIRDHSPEGQQTTSARNTGTGALSVNSISVSPRPTQTPISLEDFLPISAPQRLPLATATTATTSTAKTTNNANTTNNVNTTKTTTTSTVRSTDLALSSERSGFHTRPVTDASCRRLAEPAASGILSGSPHNTLSTIMSTADLGGGPSVRSLAAANFNGMSRRLREGVLSLVWRAVRLQNPRICPTLGIVLDYPGLKEGGGHVPVIVRQWYEFDNLERLLDNETMPLSLLTRAIIATGVAVGMSYLHAQQPPILVGPIEPARIMIDKHFNPHLLLRLWNLNPDYLNEAATHVSSHLPYVPNKSRDVYAFGVLLCQLFAPTPPAESPRLEMTMRPPNMMAAPGVAPDEGGGSVTLPTLQLEPTYSDKKLEESLVAMTDICEELGNLARACLRHDTTLSFAEIVAMLEALTAEGAIGCAVSSRVGISNMRSPMIRRSSEFRRLDDRRNGAGDITAGGRSLRVLASFRGSVEGCSTSQLGVLGSGGSIGIPLAEHLRHLRSSRHPRGAMDDLLFDIFPPKVARALQAGETVQPERYECVSIFFSDVVGYTDMCGQMQPGEVMDLVHRLYSRFDDLIREMQLFKVETVGDAYLAVGNLRWPQADSHARLMAQFAFAAIHAANSLSVLSDRPEMGTIHIRVGLHCGPVVASVVGTLNRRYCLFGDAVNTAARMEHTSQADRVHCSAAFAALLGEQWPQGAGTISRGVQEIKGKGPMETFWVEDRSMALRRAAPQLVGELEM